MSRVRVLLRKELMQLRRSRAAVLTATLLPVTLLVLMPLGQYLTLRSLPPGTARTMGPTIPGMRGVTGPEDMLTDFVLPFMTVIVGLIVPAMAATYTVVAERERRTLELLVALPVSVRDILLAKMLAMLVLAGVVLVPLFLIDAAWLTWFGVLPPRGLLLLFALLVAGLTCSIAAALLITLLARDLRTANQVNGALVGPLILVMLGIFMLVSGDARHLATVGVLLAAAAVALAIALRWLTFERYSA